MNNMKNILLLLALVVTAGCSNAQEPQNAALATKPAKPPIPDYRILTTDSVWVTPDNLKKDVPVVVIYFSPDCGHCQHMMYELKPKLKDLKGIQVVMITWSQNYDIRALREFKRDYGLANQPNFTLGTEGYTMKVQNYYKVSTTPFIAMYDAKRVFKQSFDKMPKTNDILEGIKKILKAG